MAFSLSSSLSPRFSSSQCCIGRFNGLRSSSTSVRSLKCWFQAMPKPLRISRSMKVLCVASPETAKRVVEIVTKQLAATEDSVKLESKFEELGADSLDQVEIVMALEEEFQISIDEQGSEAIKTVQDAADLIERVKSTIPKEPVKADA